MKITYLFFALFMAFGLAFSMTACDSAASDNGNDGSEATEQTEETTETKDAEATEASEQTDEAGATEADKSGPEYTSKYVCPMHCKGSGSAEAGKCPVCGMEYVMNESYKEAAGEEAAGDHDHGDHQH